jgi:hypothetical protein
MKRRLLLPLAGSVLFLAGCGPTKIGRILDEPNRYRDRNVTVEGRVERSFGAVIAGVYQVDDGTGKLYVLSKSGVPRSGSRVQVNGRVQQGITIGNRSIGTVLNERDHKVKY